MTDDVRSKALVAALCRGLSEVSKPWWRNTTTCPRRQSGQVAEPWQLLCRVLCRRALAKALVAKELADGVDTEARAIML